MGDNCTDFVLIQNASDNNSPSQPLYISPLQIKAPPKRFFEKYKPKAYFRNFMLFFLNIPVMSDANK